MIFAILILTLNLTQNTTAWQKALDSNCAIVRGATIYSDAWYSEEGGDVLGYELGIFKNNTALLFVYEGAPGSEPVPLKKNDNGTWQGSLKSVHAIVSGKLIKGRFVGTIRIENGKPEKVRLKRVPHLWDCKGK